LIRQTGSIGVPAHLPFRWDRTRNSWGQGVPGQLAPLEDLADLGLDAAEASGAGLRGLEHAAGDEVELYRQAAAAVQEIPNGLTCTVR
jgi:hypothetical protein